MTRSRTRWVLLAGLLLAWLAILRWGFDGEGRLGSLRMDFDAMAAHLLALDAAARDHGLRIEVVIFDPPLHAPLFAADGMDALRTRVRFTPRAAWVRHDEHYHVVFRPAR